MKEFKRTIRVYKNHFWDFYNTLPQKVQGKLDWTIGLVPKKSQKTPQREIEKADRLKKEYFDEKNR